jgi:hypothetical protein
MRAETDGVCGKAETVNSIRNNDIIESLNNKVNHRSLIIMKDMKDENITFVYRKTFTRGGK